MRDSALDTSALDRQISWNLPRFASSYRALVLLIWDDSRLYQLSLSHLGLIFGQINRAIDT